MEMSAEKSWQQGLFGWPGVQKPYRETSTEYIKDERVAGWFVTTLHTIMSFVYALVPRFVYAQPIENKLVRVVVFPINQFDAGRQYLRAYIQVAGYRVAWVLACPRVGVDVADWRNCSTGALEHWSTGALKRPALRRQEPAWGRAAWKLATYRRGRRQSIGLNGVRNR